VLGAVACTGGDRAATPAVGSLPPVTLLSPPSANHVKARFSPDGTRLFWWEPEGQTNQLWTADAKLANPTRVPVTSNSPEVPLWSPDGKTLAVQSSASGLANVVLVPLDGGAPRTLVGGSLSSPVAWNRDGDRFAYLTTATTAGDAFQTYVVSVTHGGRSPLVPNEHRPLIGAWSPDGAHIAYMLIDHGRVTLHVADSTGANTRPLTTDGFEQFVRDQPGFSPDGSAIAYESRRTGASDIWVAPLNGGPPRQLTHDVRNDTAPAWSADGKWVAFLSDRGKQTDIWVVPSAGGPEIRVTDDANVEELMQWLPDSRLAFLTGRGQGTLWSMSLSDSTTTQLTPDSMIVGVPILSPDGARVAFIVSRPGGERDIAVMPAGGGAIRVVVPGGLVDDNVAWSPDGTRIAFQSDRAGSRDIWMADVATGALRRLTSWTGEEYGPQWSGDGSAIYFAADSDARLSDVWKVPAGGGPAVRMTRDGTVQGVMTHPGRPEVYAVRLSAAGDIVPIRLEAGGRFVPVFAHVAGPVDILPAGDSLAIAEPAPGGGYTFRIIAASGRGEGTALLKPGETFTAASRDWRQVLYKLRDGATWDIGLLDRTTGTTRRLTNSPVDEDGAVLTPDGKTVIFQRYRSVRRIAIADLSKALPH
jgi:Tol biopolymer transport system component